MTDELPENLPDLLRGQMCPQNCADDAPGCACALAELAADEIERMAANAAQHAAAIEAARREGWCAGRDAVVEWCRNEAAGFSMAARAHGAETLEHSGCTAEARLLEEMANTVATLTPPEPAP